MKRLFARRKRFIVGKKASISILIALITLLSCSVGIFAVSEEVKVVIDGVKLNFDVPPQLIGGRTMVPLRAIFESLGVSVSWDSETKSITAYNEAYFVKATIDHKTMTVNGEKREMDIAPMIVEDRTLVPARFVAEAFDCDVLWSGETRTVSITTKPINYDSLEKGNNNTESETNSKKKESAKSKETVLFNEYSFEPVRELKIKCINVIKGTRANSIVESENMFNDKPSGNQEWIIMEFDVNYLNSSDGKNDELKAADIIYKDNFYTSNKNSLPVYDMATLGKKYKAYGVFDVKMYPGSSSRVVIGLLTEKNIGDILLRIPNEKDKDAIWISCIGSEEKASEIKEGSTTSEKKNNYSSSYFYLNSDAPTYTSVIGIKLKDTIYTEKGNAIYTYKYTNSDDVGDYWDALVADGWTLIGNDDKTTKDVFESGFGKNGKALVVNVYFDLNEVWIMP